jgi:hypothetical protein
MGANRIPERDSKTIFSPTVIAGTWHLELLHFNAIMCVLHGVKDNSDCPNNGLPLLGVLDLIENAKSVRILGLLMAVHFFFLTTATTSANGNATMLQSAIGQLHTIPLCVALAVLKYNLQ